MANPFWYMSSKKKESKLEKDIYSSMIPGRRINTLISEQDALSIPTVKSAIELISNSIAQLPIYLYREQKDGSIISIADKRLTVLNEVANDYEVSQVLKKKIVKDYLLYGKAYLLKKQNKLFYLEANKVTEELYTEDDITIAKKEFIYNSHTKVSLEEIEVIEINSGTNGIIMDNGKLLNTALSVQNYQSSLLENSAVPIGILKTSSRLTETAITRLRQGWEQLYHGTKKAGRTVILEEGLDFQPLSISPEKMQLNETTKHINSEIVKTLNIPLSMIDSSENKYNSLEQNNLTFLQSCLSPIITAIESSLDKEMLSFEEKEQGYYFRFFTEELLRSTEKEKIENISKQYNDGLISFNEMRRKLDLSKGNKDFWKHSIGNVLRYEDGQLENLNILTTVDIDEVRSIKKNDLLYRTFEFEQK